MRVGFFGKENYFVGLLPEAELSVDVLLSGELFEESFGPSVLADPASEVDFRA
jgi:hypothetical protein